MKKISLITLATLTGLSLSSASSFAEGKMHKMDRDGGRHMMHLMMDTNKDGSVSLEEMQTFRSKNFAAADMNKDGRLSAKEFSELSKIMEEQRKKMQDAAKQEKIKKYFDKLDTNKDGDISKAEFDKKGEHNFIENDENDDGLLNREDRQRRMQKMKKMMRKGGS